jgi:hypothetical protein
MRNMFLAILAGPILFGCLSAEEPNALVGAAADTTVNSSPTIAGSPASGTMYGEMYEFVPSASDADGDTLTFDAQNKPAWASFDSSTGKLYGQPTMAHIGNYDGIVVGVSDGTDRASLPAFSVTVSQTAMGVVTLNWAAPTENSDGSALMDLAGYKIYKRKNSGSFGLEIQIDNPSVTTFDVDQLSPATYYFAATAFNSMGVESSFSAEVTRIVN